MLNLLLSFPRPASGENRPKPGPTFALLALSLAWLLAPSPGAASTWGRMSFKGLCTQAELVVHARVVGSTAAFGTDGLIWTTYQLDVIDQASAAGQPSMSVQIRQFGGQVGEQRHTMAGLAPYALDSEYVFFLRTHRHGGLIAINGGQGALRVRDNTVTDLAVMIPTVRATSVANFLDLVRQRIVAEAPQ